MAQLMVDDWVQNLAQHSVHLNVLLLGTHCVQLKVLAMVKDWVVHWVPNLGFSLDFLWALVLEATLELESVVEYSIFRCARKEDEGDVRLSITKKQ